MEKVMQRGRIGKKFALEVPWGGKKNRDTGSTWTVQTQLKDGGEGNF